MKEKDIAWIHDTKTSLDGCKVECVKYNRSHTSCPSTFIVKLVQEWGTFKVGDKLEVSINNLSKFPPDNPKDNPLFSLSEENMKTLVDRLVDESRNLAARYGNSADSYLSILAIGSEITMTYIQEAERKQNERLRELVKR